ncbi:MAG: hypothetical protein HN348_01885 [Proteobacteria bacterium]|nr:hypothetical protein [Pseudomonadota bacterium]
MWLLIWGAMTLANPDRPFPRLEDETQARRYDRVEGEGPLRPRWRRRDGRILAWTFRDGTIEHYERYEGRQVVEEHRFDAVGDPLSTIHFSENKPQKVVIHRFAEVDVSSWQDHSLGGLQILTPTTPSVDGGRHTISLTNGTFIAEPVKGPADPFADDFARGLEETCRCLIVDRSTRWIDGRPSAHYHLYMPHPDVPQTGELWATSVNNMVMLLLWSTSQEASHKETGRAIVALARWENQ